MRTGEEIQDALRRIDWNAERWTTFYKTVEADLMEDYRGWKVEDGRKEWFAPGWPFDKSGDVGFVEYLVMPTYATIGAWANSEYTGEWEPTYESGYGKYWVTLDEQIDRGIQGRLLDELQECIEMTDEERNEYADELYEFISEHDLWHRWEEIETGDRDFEGIRDEDFNEDAGDEVEDE